MQIIAGKARSIELNVPPGMGVRPTAGRSRKALFDSIGGALPGCCVLDLFAGSGALALEAASRGAAALWLVESNPRHAAVIEENIRKVRRAGVETPIELLRASVLDTAVWVRRIVPAPDFIFADPPYAESAEFFRQLTADARFTEAFAGARLIWEIPDTPGAVGNFLSSSGVTSLQVRRFGGSDFLLGELCHA